MGLFSIFKKKKESYGMPLTEEEYLRREELKDMRKVLETTKRNLDLEIMIKKAELEKLELQCEIDDIRAEYSQDDGEFSPEGMFTNLIKSIMSKSLQTNEQNIPGMYNEPQAQPPEEMILQPGISIPDEDLKQLWNKVPTHQRMFAKLMSDDKIRNYLISNYPQVNKETIERAIKIARQ